MANATLFQSPLSGPAVGSNGEGLPDLLETALVGLGWRVTRRPEAAWLGDLSDFGPASRERMIAQSIRDGLAALETGGDGGYAFLEALSQDELIRLCGFFLDAPDGLPDLAEAGVSEEGQAFIAANLARGPDWFPSSILFQWVNDGRDQSAYRDLPELFSVAGIFEDDSRFRAANPLVALTEAHEPAIWAKILENFNASRQEVIRLPNEEETVVTVHSPKVWHTGLTAADALALARLLWGEELDAAIALLNHYSLIVSRGAWRGGPGGAFYPPLMTSGFFNGLGNLTGTAFFQKLTDDEAVALARHLGVEFFLFDENTHPTFWPDRNQPVPPGRDRPNPRSDPFGEEGVPAYVYTDHLRYPDAAALNSSLRERLIRARLFAWAGMRRYGWMRANVFSGGAMITLFIRAVGGDTLGCTARLPQICAALNPDGGLGLILARALAATETWARGWETFDPDWPRAYNDDAYRSSGRVSNTDLHALLRTLEFPGGLERLEVSPPQGAAGALRIITRPELVVGVNLDGSPVEDAPPRVHYLVWPLDHFPASGFTNTGEQDGTRLAVLPHPLRPPVCHALLAGEAWHARLEDAELVRLFEILAGGSPALAAPIRAQIPETLWNRIRASLGSGAGWERGLSRDDLLTLLSAAGVGFGVPLEDAPETVRAKILASLEAERAWHTDLTNDDLLALSPVAEASGLESAEFAQKLPAELYAKILVNLTGGLEWSAGLEAEEVAAAAEASGIDNAFWTASSRDSLLSRIDPATATAVRANQSIGAAWTTGLEDAALIHLFDLLAGGAAAFSNPLLDGFAADRQETILAAGAEGMDGLSRAELLALIQTAGIDFTGINPLPYPRMPFGTVNPPQDSDVKKDANGNAVLDENGSPVLAAAPPREWALMADDRSFTLLMRDDRFDSNNRKHRKTPLGILANPGILASLFYPAEWLATFLPAAPFAAEHIAANLTDNRPWWNGLSRAELEAAATTRGCLRFQYGGIEAAPLSGDEEWVAALPDALRAKLLANRNNPPGNGGWAAGLALHEILAALRAKLVEESRESYGAPPNLWDAYAADDVPMPEDCVPYAYILGFGTTLRAEGGCWFIAMGATDQLMDLSGHPMNLRFATPFNDPGYTAASSEEILAAHRGTESGTPRWGRAMTPPGEWSPQVTPVALFNPEVFISAYYDGQPPARSAVPGFLGLLPHVETLQTYMPPAKFPNGGLLAEGRFLFHTRRGSLILRGSDPPLASKA